MAIDTIQAWQNGVHRNFTDVVVVGIIGAVLMAIVGDSALDQTSAMERGLGLFPSEIRNCSGPGTRPPP